MALMQRKLFLALAALGLFAIGATGITLVSQNAFAGGGSCEAGADDGSGEDADGAESDDGDECEGDEAAPGTLDDGKELQSKATITIDQAIAAAKAATTGRVGEVDLEYHKGVLVFNVDIGDNDVKVDAGTGAILGIARD